LDGELEVADDERDLEGGEPIERRDHAPESTPFGAPFAASCTAG
jgi:hypothetical protein